MGAKLSPHLNSPVWNVQHLVWKFYSFLVEKIETDLTDIFLLYPRLSLKSQNRENLRNRSDICRTVKLAHLVFSSSLLFCTNFPMGVPPAISSSARWSAPSFCPPVSSLYWTSSQAASLASHLHLSVSLHNGFLLLMGRRNNLDFEETGT